MGRYYSKRVVELLYAGRYVMRTDPDFLRVLDQAGRLVSRYLIKNILLVIESSRKLAKGVSD